MKTTDQQASTDGIESVTRQYVELAAEYNVNVTLFITGKFCEETSTVDKINRHHVEIGGHTWNAFSLPWVYGAFGHLIGSKYGPSWYQRWDIFKTLDAVKETFGDVPRSWRTHAYLSNSDTLSILNKSPVAVVSDEVTPDKYNPQKIDNSLISLPINVMPDHEHIYHGARTRDHVENNQQGWNDAFTSESYEIDEYFQIIINQLRVIEHAGGVATLLLHPMCMKVADDFSMFERLLSWIEEMNIETLKVGDVPERVTK